MSLVFSNVSGALPSLLRALLRQPEVPSRNGTTREFQFLTIQLENPLEREVCVPGRKASLAAQIAETAWILAGRNDVEFLSHYLPRAKDFSDDGIVWRGGYGPRIRHWSFQKEDQWPEYVDQLDFVVELLKKDPTTRRAVVQIYDPAIDSADGKDIPCNDWLHFLARDGVLHLNIATRSNDVMWGWSGINAFEWSVLLEVVAHLTGLTVGNIVFNVSSFHLYEQHYKKAEAIVDQEVGKGTLRFPREAPRFFLERENWSVVGLDKALKEFFEIEELIRLGEDYDASLEGFQEPMLGSWLRVLAWHWRGDEEALDALHGTPLYWAAMNSPKRPNPPSTPAEDVFVAVADKLHREKNAAYGDSWKRRGEAIGILANIARKIDRLSGGETHDETSADTAMDLLIYLLKYRLWLREKVGAPTPFEMIMAPAEGLSDNPDFVTMGLRYWRLHELWAREFNQEIQANLIKDFEELEQLYSASVVTRWQTVDRMICRAYPLAWSLWRDSQYSVEATPAYVNQG